MDWCTRARIKRHLKIERCNFLLPTVDIDGRVYAFVGHVLREMVQYPRRAKMNCTLSTQRTTTLLRRQDLVGEALFLQRQSANSDVRVKYLFFGSLQVKQVAKFTQ